MAISEFTNTFIIILLEDKDYFDMTAKEAVKTYGDIVFTTQFVVIIVVDFTTGLFLDTMGRRLTMSIGL